MLGGFRIDNLLVSLSCHHQTLFFMIVVVLYIYIYALWYGIIHFVVWALAVAIGSLDVTTAIEMT